MRSIELSELRSLIAQQIGPSGLPPFPDSIETRRTDISKEMDHGLDVELWIRKLVPSPSFELVLAGQRHDWERVVFHGQTGGYVGDRGEAAYFDYKKSHAARSASLVIDSLTVTGLPETVVARVAFLILHHDDTGEEIKALNDPDLQMLVSADSLSFFTYIAPDMMARELGEDRIKKKMRFSIDKMDAHARNLLSLWHSPDSTIEKWKDEILHEF